MVSIAQLLDIQAENTKSQVLFACTPNEHGPQPDVAAVKGIVAAQLAVAGRRSRACALRPGGASTDGRKSGMSRRHSQSPSFLEGEEVKY